MNRPTGTPARRRAPRHGGKEVAAADPVDEHPHFDAALPGGQHGLEKAATGDVVAEDVARQGDAPLRALDRRQHRRISLVAVAQGLERVAAEEG